MNCYLCNKLLLSNHFAKWCNYDGCCYLRFFEGELVYYRFSFNLLNNGRQVPFSKKFEYNLQSSKDDSQALEKGTILYNNDYKPIIKIKKFILPIIENDQLINIEDILNRFKNLIVFS